MLRLVVALAPEARPLVERYRLRRDPETEGFPVFRRDPVALVVSGVGKAAAAGAAAFLHLATGGERDAVWLNVGVAGHATLPVGTPVLAHAVRDRASGRSWYPPLVFAPPCATDDVVTVDRPETVYGAPGAFDMEASGYLAAAGRFATAELVHCLKIVSDGPAAPAKRLEGRDLARLVGDATPVIDRVVALCAPLSAAQRALGHDPPELAECLARWRFTVTERRALRRLLRRRRALAPEAPLPLETLGADARGGDVVRRLERWLDRLPASLR